MECSEVQKRFAAYIEKAVSPKQKALIEAHLKGCKRCKESLADLKKAVKYVQKLEEVDPPPWLTQKVMAQVRSEAEAKRGIWQRLFIPFHIKIPLEAIALLFIVGTIYVFTAMGPQMQLAKAPIETKEAAPPGRAPGKGEAHDGAEAKRPSAEPEERFRYADKEKAGEEKSMKLAKAPAEAAEQEETAPAAGALAKDEVARKGVSSTVSEEAMTAREAEAVQFRVNVKAIEPATQDTEETLRQLGGRKIRTQSLRDRAVINADIESRQVKELFNQLNIIGEVQEQRGPMEGGKEEVGIRIDLEKTPK